MRTSIACLGSTLLLLAGCAGDDSGNNMMITSLPTTVGGSDGMNTEDGGDDDGSGSAGDDAPTGGSDDADTGMMDADGSDDATTGPMPSGPTCQHQCTAPADCMVNGEETGLGCNMGLCSIACSDDMQCITAISGWNLFPCSSEDDCMGAGSCIDTGGGVGGCALTPTQGPCSEAMQVEMMANAIGGGSITVCGQPAARCSPLGGQNICIIGCDGQPCAGELTCDAADGLCKCDFDTQCVDTGLGNNCNADSLCEFTCMDATGCPAAIFDGGTIVCE